MYYNLGIEKAKLGDNSGAISDYNKAIEINPEYKSAYTNRGIIKKKIGDMKGACGDWRKASSLGHKRTSQWVKNQC